ncbi:MAG: formate/nitrite transporter family protein [Clostridiales bacterium]|nr:formate/nitrite transporter family protein [Clostridiales bacterium]
MEKLRQFISACLAGFMIGMGGTVYLSQSNSVVGSCLFAVGLLTIVVFQLHLFTGKVGYLPMQKPAYILELLITWCGNWVGTYIIANMVRATRIYPSLAEKANTIAAAKLADGTLSLFILAIFCGLLMFIAVDTFKNQTGSTIRLVAVFVPVMVFILSGFEHVVADMYYFSLAKVWNAHCFYITVIMTFGNSLGGMLIPLYKKIFSVK